MTIFFEGYTYSYLNLWWWVSGGLESRWHF